MFLPNSCTRGPRLANAWSQFLRIIPLSQDGSLSYGSMSRKMVVMRTRIRNVVSLFFIFSIFLSSLFAIGPDIRLTDGMLTRSSSLAALGVASKDVKTPETPAASTITSCSSETPSPHSALVLQWDGRRIILGLPLAEAGQKC